MRMDPYRRVQTRRAFCEGNGGTAAGRIRACRDHPDDPGLDRPRHDGLPVCGERLII